MKKIWSVFLLLYFIACDFDSIELDKVQGPTLSPSLVLNLGSVKYTVGELVDDLEDESLEVVTEDDLFIIFVQRDTSIYDDTEEFIALEDEITNEESYPPFSSDIPAQSIENRETPPTEIFDFEFNPEGDEEIDSTFFKAGTLRYTLTSPFNSRINYTLTLTDIQDALTGEPHVFNDILMADETSKSGSTPLEGKKNVAKRVGSSNIFNVALDLTFIIPPNVAINASDEITLEVVFEDLEFSAVFGDFGMDPVEVQQEVIEISVFDDFGDDGLFLEEPTVTLEFINKFGIEFGISLANVKAVDDDASEILLEGDVVSNLQIVNAPDGSQLGPDVTSLPIVVTPVPINVNNSNIDKLLNNTPANLTFTVDATPNSEGLGMDENNYLSDSSYLEIRMTTEIPLDLRMDGFSRDFDFSIDGTELSDADSIVINLRVVNNIPIDGTLDLSFQDDSGEELYKLPGVESIESPRVGNGERTLSPVEKGSVIRLNDEGIEAFLKTTEVIVTLNMFTFDTESENPVKIFSDYNIEIFLTAQGKVAVDL
ncbi:MAG: hypothetical protein GDA51_08700 [Ekhidna sp.]|nr:hypothetical protein [Ekhidna sp.]MBC6409089.1 hypothetical protein [Ekhidna sp.]MBC6426529.1 hypothetical protein [Ekhidna sp.]